MLLCFLAFGLVSGNLTINKDIVQDIRSSGATWEAYEPGTNPMADLSDDTLRGLLGTIIDEPTEKSDHELAVADAASAIAFPREFDARVTFARCHHPIRDQKKCGSCWAFSVAETWADNACILGIAKDNTNVYSTQDLISCAKFGSGACQGGRINYAFDWVVSDGLVTEKCMPYTSQNGTVEACPASVGPSTRTCTTAGEKWDAASCTGEPNDLFTPDLMKQGIMQLGAVAAGYTVFQDFYNYKSGIYQHVSGKMLGGHAIKVVGWGVQNATTSTPEIEYWIVANSWGSVWGESGYFRFSFNDTDCAFGAGGAYNCGKVTPTPPTPATPTPAPAPPAPTPPPPAPTPVSPTPGPTPAPPTPAPTPAPPTPAPPTPAAPTPVPAGKCTVDPGERVQCGPTSSKSLCEAAGECCWSQTPITGLWCFKPKPASSPSSFP